MIWWWCRLFSIAPATTTDDDDDDDATAVGVVDLLAVTVVVVAKIWWLAMIGGKHVEVEVIVTIGCDDAAVVTVDGDNDKVWNGASIAAVVDTGFAMATWWSRLWWLLVWDNAEVDEETTFALLFWVNLGSNIIWWWLSTVKLGDDDDDDDDEFCFIIDSWCWWL